MKSRSKTKPKNKAKVSEALADQSLKIMFNSNLTEIEPKTVKIKVDGNQQSLENDLVYIFAGGELPTKFLENAGVKISKRFGYIMKKHK